MRYIGQRLARSSKWSVVIISITPTHPVHFQKTKIPHITATANTNNTDINFSFCFHGLCELQGCRAFQLKILNRMGWGWVGGSKPRGVFANLLFWPFFSKNCMKFNKISSKEEGVPCIRQWEQWEPFLSERCGLIYTHYVYFCNDWPFNRVWCS